MTHTQMSHALSLSLSLVDSLVRAKYIRYESYHHHPSRNQPVQIDHEVRNQPMPRDRQALDAR